MAIGTGLATSVPLVLLMANVMEQYGITLFPGTPFVIALVTGQVFKLGIAYPTHARIEGEGVGAVRHCVFSTGAFVEPITAWEPNRRIAFDVIEQPHPMDEISIYHDVDTPHLHDYLRSKRGELRIEPQPDGTCILIGTSWYEHDIWPTPYWRIWSDLIIHKIHDRVLSHIATLSEKK